MNKELLLAITAAITLASAASAQESRGNRFNYAPNIYRTEQANMPRGGYAAPVSSVPAGSVPHNLLGADPTFLAKPAPARAQAPAFRAPVAAPIARAITNASPSFGQPIPLNPVSNALPPQFKASFGKPLSSPPVVASLPNPPAMTARPAPVKSSAAPARHFGSSSGVHGVLKPPHLPAGQAAAPAKALPHIDSYGDQGYRSGQLLPTIGSGGSSANTAVKATLMRHH